MASSEERRKAVEVALAEYQALRAEIAGRTAGQSALVGIVLSAVGVVGGLIVTKSSDELILVLPLLAATLGIIYTDQDSQIALIGGYIRKTLWPFLQREVSTGNIELPSWEQRVFEYRSNPPFSYTLLKFTPFLVLVSISVVPLVLSVISNTAFDRTETTVLWIAGASLTALQITLVGLVLQEFRGQELREQPIASPSSRRYARPVTNASAQQRSAQAPSLTAWYLLVLVAIGAAVLINRVLTTVHIEIREEFAAFAVFYIVAQAVERLVEPLLITVKAPDATPQKQELAERRAEVKAATSETLILAVQAETAASQALDSVQAQRAAIAWAMASTVSLLICALLGLGLIEAIADVKGGGEWWHAIDVVVTGMAVGAGTKPLHDLITRVENSKKNSDPSTQPTTT